MSSPSTLGGILNEIALARVAFADDGTLIRQELTKKLTEGPQDPRSQSQRLQNSVSQQKITPTLAAKLYKQEVTLNDTTLSPAHRTILRHTLRNIASGSTGSIRDKVDGALFASEIGYELNTVPGTSDLPDYQWAGSAAKRPLIDLMVNTEHQDLDKFVRAVELSERSLLTGSNNERAGLAAALEQDGHPISGAVARFSNGVGLPSKTASGPQLPDEIRHSLTILYANALATGTLQELRKYLDDLSLTLRSQGIDQLKAIAATNAEFAAQVSASRGKATTSPKPPVGTQSAVQAAADFAGQMVEYMEEAKAIKQEAKAKIDLANYIQKAKGFARDAVAVEPPPEQPVAQPQDQGLPAAAATQELNRFYGSLVSTNEVNRLRSEYFLSTNHINSLPDNYPERAGLIAQRNLIGERLARIAALQEALAGRAAPGDARVRKANEVIADNNRAITEAINSGAATVVLKDPTRWDKQGNFRTARRPLAAIAQPPVEAPAAPVQEDAAGGARRSLESLASTPVADRAKALHDAMLEWAPELGQIEKGLDQEKSRDAQGRLAYGMIDQAKLDASSHGDMRIVIADLKKAVAAEGRSLQDPIKILAMPPELKRSDLQTALKSMGSKVSAEDLLKIGATMDAKKKAALLKDLPNDESLARFVAKSTVNVGKPSADPGLNATELYYIVSKITSVRFVSRDEKSATGGMTPLGKQGAAQDATGKIEESLYGERVSPPEVIKSVPVPNANDSSAVDEFIINNAGSLMPAELIRVIDGDSLVMGVCGDGPAGEKYCVRMHVRMSAGVSAKEKDEQSTQTIQQRLKDMVDLSIMVNPSEPVAKFDRWGGIIYGEDAQGKIHKINIELKKLGESNQGGFDRRYGTRYDEYGPEPSDAAIMDSLGGTGNRDPLFGNTNTYEGVVHDRPGSKTELSPVGARPVITPSPPNATGQPLQRIEYLGAKWEALQGGSVYRNSATGKTAKVNGAGSIQVGPDTWINVRTGKSDVRQD